MAYVLSDFLSGAYRALGQMEVTTATGGSTTTVIDTKLTDTYGDDDLVNGAVFVIRDAGGASAAPEKEYARISAYNATTNTITLDTALSAAVASGDTVGIVKSIYPIRTMIELANDALLSLGTIGLVDTTTLSGVGSQTEYAWAVAWKYKPPSRIDAQAITTDSNDNKWYKVEGWYVVPAAAGSTGLIVFDDNPPANHYLRIWYEATHPRLSAYSDAVNEVIHPELAVALLSEKALNWQNSRNSGSDQFMRELENKWIIKAQDAREMYPLWKPKRQPRPYTLNAPASDMPPSTLS